MTTERYQKALDDLAFAQDAMQQQLRTATAYEGMLLLIVLKQLAETRALIHGMLNGAQAPDSVLNIH